MDRDHVTKPGAQIGFITYILLPMFEVLAKVSARLIWSESKMRLKNFAGNFENSKPFTKIVRTYCHSQL